MVQFRHSTLSCSEAGSEVSRPLFHLLSLCHSLTEGNCSRGNHHGIRSSAAHNNATTVCKGRDKPKHHYAAGSVQPPGRAIANSTICLSSEKPIVRMPRPQDFNKQLLSLTAGDVNIKCPSKHDTQSSYDKEAEQRRWTTTKVATEEYALPTPRYPIPSTTLEPCADSVRYRARETNQKPFLWQSYTREWDMKQLRHPPKKAQIINLPTIPKNCAMVQLRAKRDKNLLRRGDLIQDSNCRENESPLFTRPMPGYGGFIPHHPVDPKPITDMDCVTASMCSTSRRTYRSYPPEEYHVLTFAHPGPLSTTITLTAPFNPFNKVEQC